MYLTWLVSVDNKPRMMRPVRAQPDYDWGQRPCEGLVPSALTCFSGGRVAARRTPPGWGAACWRSNVAERISLSYGGQHFCWSDKRKKENEQETSPSSSATAPIKMALDFYNPRYPWQDLRLPVFTMGMMSVLLTAPLRKERSL